MSHSFILKSNYHSNETTRYNSLEDFLCRTDRGYRDGRGSSYKLKDYFDFCQVFYSEENMDSCPHMIIPTEFYSTSNLLDSVNDLKKQSELYKKAVKVCIRILKDLPPDLKKYLFLIPMRLNLTRFSSTEYEVNFHINFLHNQYFSNTTINFGGIERTDVIRFKIDLLENRTIHPLQHETNNQIFERLKTKLQYFKEKTDFFISREHNYNIEYNNITPAPFIFLNVWNLDSSIISKYKTTIDPNEEYTKEKAVTELYKNNLKDVRNLTSKATKILFNSRNQLTAESIKSYMTRNVIGPNDPMWINSHVEIIFLKKYFFHSNLGATSHKQLVKNIMNLSEEEQADILNTLWWGDHNYLHTNIIICNQRGSVREELYRVFNYSANVLDYVPYKQNKMAREYGIELECATDLPVNELIDKQKELFFFAKSDSSVTGNKAYKVELVTVPLSLKDHKKHWSAFFENVDYNFFDVSKKTNNGMHIHIGIDHFNDREQQKRFCWFFQSIENRLGIYTISERHNLDGFFNYSRPIEFPRDRSYTHCYKNVLNYTQQNRGIINIKSNTIEVRLFRGIVSLGEIIKNLEFTDAVFEFTAPEKNFRHLTFTHFLKWLKETPKNKYLTLKYYLEEIKTDYIEEGVTYGNIIKNSYTEQDVRDAFNKRGIPIDSENLDMINSILELSVRSNKVRLRVTPKSLALSNLDHSLFKSKDKDLSKQFLRTAAREI